MKRMNGNHEILVAVPVNDRTEIVIGKRNTEFQPYAVWYCYNGNDYETGAYVETYNGALNVLADRIRPTYKVYEECELRNFGEDCDAIIPYLSDDEGFKNAKERYMKDPDFKAEVVKAYREYWHRYLDDIIGDYKFDTAIDALSRAWELAKIKEAN